MQLTDVYSDELKIGPISSYSDLMFCMPGWFVSGHVGSFKRSELRFMSKAYISEFATQQSIYLRQYIVFGEQKAAFLFAIVSTFLGYLNQKNITRLWMTDPRGWKALQMLSCFSTIGLALGATLALIVVWPRGGGTLHGIIHAGESLRGLKSADEYLRKVHQLSSDEITSAELRHCYELSLTANRKYRWLNRAIWVCSFGLAASIACIFFS